MTADVKCMVCQQTRAWHEEYKPRHGFVDPSVDPAASGGASLGRSPRGNPGGSSRGQAGGSSARPPEDPRLAIRRMGVDPVLRMTLVRAGVLKTEDLFEVEGILAEAIATGRGAVVVNDKGEIEITSPPPPPVMPPMPPRAHER